MCWACDLPLGSACVPQTSKCASRRVMEFTCNEQKIRWRGEGMNKKREGVAVILPDCTSLRESYVAIRDYPRKKQGCRLNTDNTGIYWSIILKAPRAQNCDRYRSLMQRTFHPWQPKFWFSLHNGNHVSLCWLSIMVITTSHVCPYRKSDWAFFASKTSNITK